jgi:hypothetical protein
VQNRGKSNQNRPDADAFAEKWMKKHVEKVKKVKMKEHVESLSGQSIYKAEAGGEYNERIAV